MASGALIGVIWVPCEPAVPRREVRRYAQRVGGQIIVLHNADQHIVLRRMMRRAAVPGDVRRQDGRDRRPIRGQAVSTSVPTGTARVMALTTNLNVRVIEAGEGRAVELDTGRDRADRVGDIDRAFVSRGRQREVIGRPNRLAQLTVIVFVMRIMTNVAGWNPQSGIVPGG